MRGRGSCLTSRAGTESKRIGSPGLRQAFQSREGRARALRSHKEQGFLQQSKSPPCWEQQQQLQARGPCQRLPCPAASQAGFGLLELSRCELWSLKAPSTHPSSSSISLWGRYYFLILQRKPRDREVKRFAQRHSAGGCLSLSALCPQSPVLT